jgi:hypothetical protein
MDHQLNAGHAGPGRDDRISMLGDSVLGHILSFLDTKEAARAAVLSSRWRDILASVHTVSMEEPEAPIPEYDDEGYRHRETDPKPPFTALVNAALIARSLRPAPAAASAPLRALRVAMESYTGIDAFTVDQWLTYAMKHAAPDLKLYLRVRRVPVCSRPDPYRHAVAVVGSDDEEEEDDGKTPVDPQGVDEDDDVASSVDEMASRWWSRPPAVYTVPRRLFSCSALRSLHLASCRLSPPEAISLPSLQALGLTHVPDEEEHVQKFISACPRLADLTLEACATVTMLSLLDNTCLRRLALLCCHKLATVTVDASELRSFEYRGAVPSNSFLTVRGGFPSITSCKVDVCAVCLEEEATTSEQLAALSSFLQPFASTTKRLQLRAAHMGSCFVALPAFQALRNLQLFGRVPRDGTGTDLVAATCTILSQAPHLELLALFFEAAPPESSSRINRQHYSHDRKETELLEVHNLHHNKYDTIDSDQLAAIPLPPCLSSTVRRIKLVHYQGGRAERTLARFLLRNAAALEKLFCEFSEGPLRTQKELTLEMEGWVVNDKAIKEFY